MRRLAICLMLLLVGCNGNRVGQILEVPGQRTLWLDQTLYEEAAELRAAGANDNSVHERSSSYRQWRLLYKGSKVRVLAHVRDGYKVLVEFATDRQVEEKPPGNFVVTYTEKPDLKGVTGYLNEADFLVRDFLDKD